MRLQTFYDWLTREVVTSRMALARLYETRDRLLYVEAPPLRQRYLALFGEGFRHRQTEVYWSKETLSLGSDVHTCLPGMGLVPCPKFERCCDGNNGHLHTLWYPHVGICQLHCNRCGDDYLVVKRIGR